MHTRPMTRRLLVALLGVLALVAAACGDDDSNGNGDEGATPPDGPTIVIGAQQFGESEILAQIYGQALADAGYPVQYQALGGYRDIVFSSFEGGQINFTAEYAASALEFLNQQAGEATPEIDATAALLRDYLGERGLYGADASPAVNSNAFVVTRATADDKGITSIGDLTDDMVLGGPSDCPTNPFCIPGLRDVYGIDLEANFRSLEGPAIIVPALEGNEIDVAILFSTDGVISDKDFVVLEDDQGLINADNIIPVFSQELVDAYGDDFLDLVNSISAALDTDGLTELNRLVDIELEDADAVARGWLEENGF